MEVFKEYFITLFWVCILCSLCDIISGFTSEGLARALKLVCSLTLLLAVFPTAFSGCSSNFSDLSSKLISYSGEISGNEADSLLIEKSKEELENNVSLAIYEKFGIKPDSVSIEFSVKEKDGVTEVSVVGINIKMPQDADKATMSAVKLFADELFGIADHSILTE